MRYKYITHKTSQSQRNEPRQKKSKKYVRDLPGKGADHRTGTQISNTSKTLIVGLLLLVLIAVYTTRNMSAFANYGVANTILYSINKNRVMIQDSLNSWFAKYDVAQETEDTTLHEIVNETPPQIPSIYISSTVTQGVNNFNLSAFNRRLALLNEHRFWTDMCACSVWRMVKVMACKAVIKAKSTHHKETPDLHWRS